MKNTQNRELRKLAEKYFFEKSQLEEHEVALLKSSKYASLLSPIEGSVFSELAENVLQQIEENALTVAPTKPSSKGESPMHHANSGDLEGLTDGIKDEFDISVPPDYSHVPVDKLKEFIKSYTDQYIDDMDTKFEVQNALKLNDARSIMGSLYTHLTM